MWFTTSEINRSAFVAFVVNDLELERLCLLPNQTRRPRNNENFINMWNKAAVNRPPWLGVNWIFWIGFRSRNNNFLFIDRTRETQSRDVWMDQKLLLRSRASPSVRWIMFWRKKRADDYGVLIVINFNTKHHQNREELLILCCRTVETS